MHGKAVSKSNTVPISEDRILPHHYEIEEVVLGALLLEAKSAHEVLDFLQPDCFYDVRHQQIFSIILNLNKSLKPIDIVIVKSELERQGILEKVGGPSYLTELTSRVASSAHIKLHAMYILEDWLRRSLIEIGNRYIKDSFSYGEDIFDLIEGLQSELRHLMSPIDMIEKRSITPDEVLLEIEQRIQNSGTPCGITTGNTELDFLLGGGWQKSDLIVIAGRPSMGKTSVALQFAVEAAQCKQKTLFLSLEMSKEQVLHRLLQFQTGISTADMRRGSVPVKSLSKLKTATKLLKELPLFVIDPTSANISRIESIITKANQSVAVDLIIIDYLLLIETESNSSKLNNRATELGLLTKQIKRIAKNFRVPIILLTQLNRLVESRDDKRPILSDLRDSGQIEEDADLVLLLYRDSYYWNKSKIKSYPTIEIDIAKNRNGETKRVSFSWDEKKLRFVSNKSN